MNDEHDPFEPAMAKFKRASKQATIGNIVLIAYMVVAMFISREVHFIALSAFWAHFLLSTLRCALHGFKVQRILNQKREHLDNLLRFHAVAMRAAEEEHERRERGF